MSDYGVHLLAFSPHPDDVELFCGGILLRMQELGYRTGIVDLSRGELASNGTASQRREEAEAAGRILGLSFRENLGLPDAWIDPWSGYAAPASSRATQSHLTRAVEVIRRRRPEILLLPWIEARHPDHAAAGQLLTKAAYFAGVRKLETDPPSERFVPAQVLHYPLRHSLRPSFIVDTSAVAARKRQAIACYASQLEVGDQGDATLVGSAAAVDAIEARDRYYGSMIGVSHGEPLRAPGALALMDPVAHFRQNPVVHAHFFEAQR